MFESSRDFNFISFFFQYHWQLLNFYISLFYGVQPVSCVLYTAGVFYSLCAGVAYWNSSPANVKVYRCIQQYFFILLLKFPKNI